MHKICMWLSHVFLRFRSGSMLHYSTERHTIEKIAFGSLNAGLFRSELGMSVFLILNLAEKYAKTPEPAVV